MNRYKAFEVTIFKSFTVVDGETLLKASERCLGHIIKVGCRGGGCGVWLGFVSFPEAFPTMSNKFLNNILVERILS